MLFTYFTSATNFCGESIPIFHGLFSNFWQVLCCDWKELTRFQNFQMVADIRICAFRPSFTQSCCMSRSV